MANLRAQYFVEIEAVYADIKALIQQCDRTKEKTIASGLKKISRAISRIVNYQAINQEYWDYIGGASTALNCLINLYGWRISKGTKEALSNLFNRLAAILPDDFQLNLFEASKEFGWNRAPEEETTSPKRNIHWFHFIKKVATVVVPQWLTQVLKRDWESAFEGIQLTLTHA